MADGFTSTPPRGISEQAFAADILEALGAGDTAEAERLVLLWIGYLEDNYAF